MEMNLAGELLRKNSSGTVDPYSRVNAWAPTNSSKHGLLKQLDLRRKQRRLQRQQSIRFRPGISERALKTDEACGSLQTNDRASS
jgi:hypothetical protein